MSARAIQLTSIDIDNALERNHLSVVYQPIVDLESRQIVRFEMFVRWDHPGLGCLPPGAFLPFFESQGRIGELTRHILNSAVKAYHALGTDQHTPSLSLNLSATDVADPTLANDIKRILAEANVPTTALTLECPSISGDAGQVTDVATYAKLANIGCPLALEHRSRTLEALQEFDPFPFTEIKVGGSQILRYTRSSRGGPALSSLSDLLAFANDHGVSAVAVGIEDDATAKALSAVGFTAGQGRLLGRARSLEHWTRARSTPTDSKEADAPTEAIAPSASPSKLDDDSSSAANQRARLVAAKQAAVRKFNAAQNARQLQSTLIKDLTSRVQDETPPLDLSANETVKTSNDAPARAERETVVSPNFAPTSEKDGVSAAPVPPSPPQPATDMEALLSELPANIRSTASEQPSKPAAARTDQKHDTPYSDGNAEPLEAAADERLDELVSRLKTVTSPSQTPAEKRAAASPVLNTAEIRAQLQVPPPERPPFLIRVLRRKYRITHFWPRSWKRAWAQRQASRLADQAQ